MMAKQLTSQQADEATTSGWKPTFTAGVEILPFLLVFFSRFSSVPKHVFHFIEFVNAEIELTQSAFILLTCLTKTVELEQERKEFKLAV